MTRETEGLLSLYTDLAMGALMLKSLHWKRLQAIFAFPKEDIEFLVKKHLIC